MGIIKKNMLLHYVHCVKGMYVVRNQSFEISNYAWNTSSSKTKTTAASQPSCTEYLRPHNKNENEYESGYVIRTRFRTT
jgi:hypothetical protein